MAWGHTRSQSTPAVTREYKCVAKKICKQARGQRDARGSVQSNHDPRGSNKRRRRRRSRTEQGRGGGGEGGGGEGRAIMSPVCGCMCACKYVCVLRNVEEKVLFLCMPTWVESDIDIDFTITTTTTIYITTTTSRSLPSGAREKTLSMSAYGKMR
jgi:hypothetical protein